MLLTFKNKILVLVQASKVRLTFYFLVPKKENTKTKTNKNTRKTNKQTTFR